MSPPPSEEGSLIERAHARIGLLGNPSDGDYGKALAMSVAGMYATVRLDPSPSIVIEPHPKHDVGSCFGSLGELEDAVNAKGYYGGVRLLVATCKVFKEHCDRNALDLAPKSFRLSYDTNIPRQVGLSGSSAIICAALKCLVRYYGVQDRIAKAMLPSLMLRAEETLGINAGLMDRVQQVYGGVVHMDFDRERIERVGYGIYTPIDPSLLPDDLYLMYASQGSDSGRIHATVKRRWLEGDAHIIDCMQRTAALADDGRAALESGDLARLSSLMDQNFALRREMFGDACLGDTNLSMVAAAKSAGASAKFTGSGGACVVYLSRPQTQLALLKEACERLGVTLHKVRVEPAS